MHTKKCQHCLSVMLIKQGKYGLFWGCSSFPKCNHTEDVKQTENHIPWTNASAIGSVHFCPNSLYLRKRKLKANFNALQKMQYGKRSHQLAARDTRCYLATFAFHEQHPHVLYLRNWRDQVLLKRWYGKFWVECYYQLSPFAIIYFGHSKFFRHFAKKFVVWFVKQTKKWRC